MIYILLRALCEIHTVQGNVDILQYRYRYGYYSYRGYRGMYGNGRQRALRIIDTGKLAPKGPAATKPF